jgi:hypothetical protein
VFQAYSRRPTEPAVFHHFTVEDATVCDDTCFARTIHRLGAGPTK